MIVIFREGINLEDKINKSKDYIIRNYDIPKDALFNVPKIIVDNNKKITIENHKGIAVFKRDKVKINSNIGVIEFEGDSFEILYIGENTLIINGNLKTINYEGYKKYDK